MAKLMGRKMAANFIVQYSDDSEVPHCLTLSKYGVGMVHEGERWVLLERRIPDVEN